MIPGLLDGLFGFGTAIIERVWPDPTEQAKAKLELMKLQQSGELAKIAGQLEINKVEAQHSSIFVAGWRPFVGWVCGAAFAYTFVLQPVLVFAAQVVSTYSGAPVFDVALLPVLDWGILSSCLFGMLGIGAMRSYDKKNGVDTKAAGKPTTLTLNQRTLAR